MELLWVVVSSEIDNYEAAFWMEEKGRKGRRKKRGRGEGVPQKKG